MTVRLRPLHDEDLDELFRWESDPAGVEMAAFTRADPGDRDAFDAHYQRVRSDPDTTTLAVESHGVLVGMIASFTLEGERELTYWIDPVQWGRGVASEAVQAFLGCETRRPLFARAAAHNVGSNKVLRRNGFTQIGEETNWAAGANRDVVEYIYQLD